MSKKAKMELRNKKILMMGLGILGGGVATARFLVEKGAKLTITDMKNADYLSSSLKKLDDLKNIDYVLGEHRQSDFLENEIIVINPDVPAANKFVQLAKQNGKQIENELTLFYEYCPSRKIVAITGTRGKTTTTNWTAHLIKNFYRDTVIAGNSTEDPFLLSINKCTPESVVVMEVPSYQLELLRDPNPIYAPKVALITNIYQDHLVRHGTMEEYARTKANIFKSQSENDFLVLNKDNKWSKFLLDLKPRAKISFFSSNDNSDLFNKSEFIAKWGSHNLLNIYAAISAARAMGVTDKSILESVKSLPQIKFREEKVFESKNLEIYNDTSATSPEATIAAIERFKTENSKLILITGGTDKELDFTEWVKVVNANLNPDSVIFLSGSATEKMKNGLKWTKFKEFEKLEDCLSDALKIVSEKTIILFSPSSKSFEKFKNEYDRGEKFNTLVNQIK